MSAQATVVLPTPLATPPMTRPLILTSPAALHRRRRLILQRDLAVLLARLEYPQNHLERGATPPMVGKRRAVFGDGVEDLLQFDLLVEIRLADDLFAAIVGIKE